VKRECVFIFKREQMEDFKLINDTKRYFIHRKGYVFKTQGLKEVEIKINIVQGVPRVNIGNKKLNLVLLMLEYFADIKSSQFKYSFKLKNNRLPLENINVTYLKEDSSHDETLAFQFNCQKKATSQNSRVDNKQKLTSLDVLNCLKRTDFKCFYCGVKLKAKSWHLDHVYPLSKGGLNTPQNITPSCKECNLMKGSLGLDKFLHQVRLIAENYSLINKEF
jgi:5-methylcytosine-specific restriction endonuclease McrA